MQVTKALILPIIVLNLVSKGIYFLLYYHIYRTIDDISNL